MPSNPDGYDMGLFWLTLVGMFHWCVSAISKANAQHAEYERAREREFHTWLAEEQRRKENMGTKTIKIELRYNSPEGETDKVMRQVTRECARTLMASAMLVSNNRAPQIAVTCEDVFAADVNKIDIMMDELDDAPQLEHSEEEGAEA